jgi:exodeoxyribonuclease VII large subunit
MKFKVLTPTEYTEILNEGLADFSAVLEGEISEYKINQGKWIFFKIKDKDSILDCFSTSFQIKTPLEDGMQVRLYGTPKIYPKSGRFSLTVSWVEASGEGALKRAFELLKEEMEREGLFSLSRKREIPKFPNKIGLIASKESAAYKDFLKVLSERFPMEISLFNVSVQGENSISEIVSAFEYFNDNKEKLGLDLIVLTRGGGSLEDLKSFNSREVAYAVFGSLVPVVCGVGHEQDVSLADYVSDLRASTPSNAAELISPQKKDILENIENKKEKIEKLFLEKKADFDVDFNLYKINKNFEFFTKSVKSEIDKKTKILEEFIQFKIKIFSSLYQSFLNAFKIFEQKLLMKKYELDSLKKLLESFSPKNILKRGYSIVRLDGKLVSSIKNIKKKDKVKISLSDGEFSSEVLSIKNNLK